MVGNAMASARVTYSPASGATGWWAAVDDGALAVLSPTLTAATAASVWRGLGGGGIGAVIEALTGAFGTSLTAIPPFALAVIEAGGVRVAVRGDIEIVIEGASPEAVSGAGVATWTERFVAGAVRASVVPAADRAADAAEVPVASGVVRADLVRIDLTASARPDAEAPPVAEARAAVDVPAPVEVRAPVEVPAVAEEMTDAEEMTAAVASSNPAVSSASAEAPTAPVIDSVPGVATNVADDGEPVVTGVPDSSADTLIPEATAADAAPAPLDEYDLLWGETVARPVSAAASAVAVEDADAEAAPSAPAAAPADLSAGSPDELGDHDGATIAVSELRALRADRAPFESTDSVPARRPTRGRIRLSTGRVVELERPVIIGRRPKSTRTSGAELPTLVAVDSPEQDISRSHVEIRAEGEHVLVIDLATTNGTVLLRGGSEPVRLHPNEPTMVVTGDVLDLGDDVTVTFEDLP